MDSFLADERGHYYPGPLPFTPLRITDQGQYKLITMCVIDTGFALDAATHRHIGRPHVQGYGAMAKRTPRGWLVASFVRDNHVRCAGVVVTQQRW
jgi:hypothetical protein